MWGRRRGIKHERGQYLSELQLKLVKKCFSYSTAVHGSRQTVCYNTFVLLTIIPFISTERHLFHVYFITIKRICN